MTNTQVVNVDLTQPGWQGTIFAVAGDIYSRFVQMNLFAAGQPYEPPSGVSCVIGWRRGANFGTYDQIAEPDGTSSTHQAWEISGNVLTIELNWQVTAKAGPVGLNVAMIGQDGSRLHTWELLCQVQPGAVADADDPTLPSESGLWQTPTIPPCPASPPPRQPSGQSRRPRRRKIPRQIWRTR